MTLEEFKAKHKSAYPIDTDGKRVSTVDERNSQFAIEEASEWTVATVRAKSARYTFFDGRLHHIAITAAADPKSLLYGALTEKFGPAKGSPGSSDREFEWKGGPTHVTLIVNGGSSLLMYEDAELGKLRAARNKAAIKARNAENAKDL